MTRATKNKHRRLLYKFKKDMRTREVGVLLDYYVTPRKIQYLGKNCKIDFGGLPSSTEDK
jgi:hypothetical protein